MSRTKIMLPLETHGSVYFVDEAGSKGTAGEFFVTAAVKTRNPDAISRIVQSVRDRYGFTSKSELKFKDVTKFSLPILATVVEEVASIGTTFGAFVLDKRHFDPWANKEQWKGHLMATERLLRGMATRQEVCTALLDHISVPNGISYGDELLTSINNRFGNKRFTSAVSLDSRTCYGLQVADLIASAVFFHRKSVEEHGLEGFARLTSPKASLSRRIAEILELPTFEDGVSPLANIQTSHEQSLTELKLQVLS